jgi:glycosyltransferase 2 family protein
MKFGWRGALGVALSAGLLYWALKGHTAEIANGLRRANYGLLVAAALAATLIFPLRARRWRTILHPIAPHLPLGMLWRSTAIGMMINNVLPLRAGEVARAYALTRETPRVSFPASFASLAVDRVFDAVVLLLLMAVAMLAPGFPDEARIAGRSVESLAVGFALAAFAVAGLLYALVFFPDALVRVYDRLSRRLSAKLRERGRRALLSFAEGLTVLRHPKLFLGVFGWTVAHWLLNAFAFWIGFQAVGIDAPYSAALMLQGVIAIGVAVPSAPGFVGVFQAFARLGLALYGVSEELAVTWAVAFHVAAFIPITIIGATYLARLRLGLGELRTAAQRTP